MRRAYKGQMAEESWGVQGAHVLYVSIPHSMKSPRVTHPQLPPQTSN